MKNTNTKKALSSILSICLALMLLLSTVVVSPAALLAGAAPVDEVTVTYNYQTGKYDVSGSIDNAEYFIVVWEYWNGAAYQKIDFKTVKAVSTGNLQYAIDRQVFLDVDKDGIFRVGATNYKSNPLSYVYCDPFTLNRELEPVVTTDLSSADWAAINGAFGYTADDKDTLAGFADIPEGGVGALNGKLYYNRSVNDAFSSDPAHYTGYYVGFKMTLPEKFAGVAPADTVVTVKYTSVPGETTGSLVFNKVYGAEIFTDDGGNAALFLKHIDASVQSIDITVDWDGDAAYFNTLNYTIDLSAVECVEYAPSTATISYDVAADYATPVNGFAGNDANLVWTPDGNGGYVLTGEIWYNPDLSAACNRADVYGYGMAFKVLAIAGSEVTVYNAQGDIVIEDVMPTSGYLNYVWDVEAGDIIYVKVDNDKDAGNLYKPTTYKLDLTKVVLQPDVEYTVVFVDADNEAVMGTSELAIGDKVTTTPSTDKTGYDFIGWFVKDPTGAFVQYDFDLIYGYDILDSTTTIYACYDAYDYTIDFVANGGDGTMASLDGEYGKTVKLPANAFTRFGYKFTGWKVEGTTLKGMDGTVYNEGDIIPDGKAVAVLPAANNTSFVLTAQWEVGVYNINYVIDTNTSNNPDNPATYTVEDTVEFKAPSLNAGYLFVGWTMNGVPVTGIQPGTLAEDITVVAVYDAYDYTIYFDRNGGEGTMASLNGEYGQIATIPENGFTRFGYNFLGWKITGAEFKDLDDNTYADGDIIPGGKVVYVLPVANDTDYVLKAQWELAVYNINYVLDSNVSNNPDNPATYTVLDTVEFKAPSLNPGCAFIAWTLNGVPVTGIQPGTLAEDITLIPKWDVLTFDITVEHIFENGYMTSYVDGTSFTGNNVGDTVLVTVDVPYGYRISEAYLTTPAGVFYEYVEDVEIDNPIEAAYHITMPDKDLKLSVVYECILHEVVINNIYDGGAEDDADYQYPVSDVIHEGDAVIITADVLDGYAVNEIYFTTYTAGGAFVEVLENIAIEKLNDYQFVFTMPNMPVIVNIVYRSINRNINANYIYNGGAGSIGTYYDGPTSANAGDMVIFSAEAPDDYTVSEVYAMCGAGQAFVEVLPLDTKAGAYYFTMPEEDVDIVIVFKYVRRSITVQNIFEDGTMDDTNYYVGDTDALEGEKVIFTVNAPDGYTVSEIYATFGAGQAFVQVLPVESVAGAYYFTMPEDDVTISVVYKKVLFNITALYFQNDTVTSTEVYYDNLAGTTVAFVPVVPAHWAVDYVVATYKVGTFDEIIDVTKAGTAYMFTMPEADVTVNVILKCVEFDVNITEYIGTDIYNTSTLVDQVTGSTVVITPVAPEGYAVEEVFATVKVGVFDEFIDLEQKGTAYVFEMPEGEVTVSVFYKCVKHDVTINGYIDDALFDTKVIADQIAGSTVIIYPEIPAGYAIDEIIATTDFGTVFIELIDMQQVSDVYYFTMPENAVTVTVIYKESYFDVNTISMYDGNVLFDTSYGYVEAGTDFIFSMSVLPGKVIDHVKAVSAADETVEYPIGEIAGGTYTMVMPEEDVNIYIYWVDALVTMTVVNVDEDGNVLYTYEEQILRDSQQLIDLEYMLMGTAYDGFYKPYDWYSYIDAKPFVEYVNVIDYFNDSTLVIEGVTENLTVVIEWNKTVYEVTVRLITTDAEVLNEQTSFSASDILITLPVDALIPEGYELSEIFVTEIHGAFGEPVVFDYGNGMLLFLTPEADFTIDIVVEKIVNTVSYYAYINGEYKLFGSEEVEYGAKAEFGKTNTPEALEGGYMFIGWYYGEELYDFDTAVKASIDLIAVYDYDSFTVSFDSDGGSAVESQIVVAGGKAVEPVSPVKEGYDFDGWYNGTDKYDFATAVVADLTLKAQWTKKTFTVDLPTGEGYTAEPADGQPTTIGYGDDFDFTVTPDQDVDPEKITVYVNGKPLDPTSENNYKVENVTEPIVITVVVEKEGTAETFTVKFHYYDGDNAAEISNTVLKGASVTAPADTYRYTYKFLGWFDNAEGTGTAVTDFTNVQADAEYYAIYEQNPLADYTFGTHSVVDSDYGMGFKEIKIEVVKNDAEYIDRDVYVVVAAQLKDGSTILFYVPATVENGEASVEVSLILNSKTFTSADMYLVYDEVDLSGAINFVDVEPEILLA